ncbi:MAG TPA: bifunctional phosphoribosylaminoimidazolecarboxamide formyltransferase/IMP cyclohydrolase [Verrucomicrobiae bacterium]|jgi:phosphoribosylaminoimidazolecarboxamide formyltransferase/IMP cyclohydrolase|nr:bifunctional phosphoribosylaminoimidazolecarboxamide formyltransferase/IMP cyclohydrolase [Verrucomicrobiae bacterium]
MAKIQRALLSVFDKTGLLPFAQALAAAGVEIISTGGTAKVLREHGVMVSDLSAFTEWPEMLDGRVKTLHPKIHGGLLYVRGDKKHESAARKHGIKPIDLVVVNLYPFAQTIARPGATLADAIENIDIGGPAMLRSGAKNHQSVTVVMDPMDYAEVAGQLLASGDTTPETRSRLAAKVFANVAAYDGQIAAYLAKTFGLAPAAADAGLPAPPDAGQPWPAALHVDLPKARDLRYGENPHQRAALYGKFDDYFQQLHGKELSYNNILDLTAAAALAADFADGPPMLAIFKHTNPCGAAVGGTLPEAWEKALATDRQAPFGGIIAVNQPLDLDCAEAVAEIFSEVIVAPDFAPEALALLQKKKNLRLIKTLRPVGSLALELRSVGAGSVLAQEPDVKTTDADGWRLAAKRPPTEAEKQAMMFGWKIAKHVKSNAIVFAAADRTLGIGAGQMSRLDACRLAVEKARAAGLSLAGSAVCSDAFFPFADGLALAAEAGATAAIQPGGSVRDEEVIAAADQHGMAMAFTGTRHFRH